MLSTGETLIGQTYCGACLRVFQAMSFILDFKRSTVLDLELYFPEEEMDKVLCCSKNCSDFRVISALTS